MSRILWLALFCFASLGFLSMIKFTVGRGQAVGLPSLASDVVDAGKASAKGDRLPLQTNVARPLENFTDDLIEINARHQAGLLALKKAAAATASGLKPDGATDEVISWHWREGAKIVRKRRPP
jgi:hypothetical protein